MAVAYFDRYAEQRADNAQRTDACAPDPKLDREAFRRRVAVLRDLAAHVLIQTVPGNAQITIERKDNGVVVKRGASGDTFELVAGDYVIRTDLRGYEAKAKVISPRIGKPDNHLIPLTAQTGTLSVQVSPGDAKIYLVDGLVDRFVGVGKYEAKLEARKYVVRAEKAGRIELGKEVEVKPDLVTQVPIELVPQRQFGRNQLIGFTTVASTFAAGGLLNAFGNTGIASAGALGGGAAGAVFSYFYLPRNLDLGTSNLTITSTLAGAVVGTAGTLVFTDNDKVVGPVVGATMILGGAAGYYFGDATRVRPGDAALVGTAVGWGTFAGLMFAESFNPKRQIYAGLVLSGFGMGAVSGGLMTRYFDISRTHAVLLDVGGVIGVLGGLALEGLIYGGAANNENFSESQREHIANFARRHGGRADRRRHPDAQHGRAEDPGATDPRHGHRAGRQDDDDLRFRRRVLMATTEHQSACPLDCPDLCGLRVTVENGRVTKVDGDLMTVVIPVDNNPINARGRTPVAAGLLALGTGLDDPCFDFEFPLPGP
jgi:hypothetical protein